MFEIRELRHLLSLDEFRHFGRAAKAVGLSQPALTKSLQRFESTLGAKLFDRSRARVIPTEIGKEVIARAHRLVREADELKRTVDKMSGTALGSVALGVGPAMSESYVAETIAEMTTQHPLAHIAIRVDHWQRLSDWLLEGELDFYVADIGEAKLDRRFHYTNLPSQNLVWFCRSGHPLSKMRKKSITRSQLIKYPLASPKLPPWATEWFAAAVNDDEADGPPRPLPAIECETYSTLKRIVLASDCVSAALERTLTKELQEGTIVALNLDAPQLTTHAGIIWLRDRPLSPLAIELIRAIENKATSSSPS